MLIKKLRSLGCSLPIQVWRLNEKERDQKWLDAVRVLGVECIDASVMSGHPISGWPLKSYSILHCSFEEVLFIDSDNVPVIDPSFLFDDFRYKDIGCIFWPDAFLTIKNPQRVQDVFGVFPLNPEQESGQILINKRKCWKALNLCNWYNENSDFFYKFVYGDKDTFNLAWRKIGQKFVMVDKSIAHFSHGYGQHDLDGRLLFQHRCRAKWSFNDNTLTDALNEKQCLQFIEELRQRFNNKKLFI